MLQASPLLISVQVSILGSICMRIQQSMSLAVLALIVCACGTNPVTGKREIQFVSESQEVKIGEENYAPARQAEGGDMETMPALTAYVNEVGQKLAAVADRKLPYEFKVLNNSVPNAWAMPGGKISINRGLLTELKSEAELAAVLGHEIVHAAARHGAKAQERGTLMQAGMAVAQIGAAVGGLDPNVAGIVVGGAGAGLQMVQLKYGRDQELESDYYGMKYMKAAGYDPTAAVSLQETFVRLSGGKEPGFIDGLFASHPPSPERVAKNKETAAALGAGGITGEQQYATRLASLTKVKPAYDKFDQAAEAMQKKNYTAARSAVQEAIRLYPQEGRFHEFLGEIEIVEKKPAAAVPHYEQAIRLNPNYFGSYLGGGVAQAQGGNKQRAQEWLKRSYDLLPTAPAAYYLGNLAKEGGDSKGALQFYKTAAQSDSNYGKLAAKELVQIDLPQNPGQYVATGLQRDAQGRVVVVVQNRAPVPLKEIQVTPVLVDASGRIVQSGNALRVAAALPSGEQVALNAGLDALTPEQLQSVRVRVDSAKISE